MWVCLVWEEYTIGKEKKKKYEKKIQKKIVWWEVL